MTVGAFIEPRFTLRGDTVIVDLPPEERNFLSQVLVLLADVGEDPADPASQRLNVPVYLDDPSANEEWWRLMRDELDSSRESDRGVFQRVMVEEAPVEMSVDEADAFLRVLNEGRLALAARLGLEVEEDHERIPDEERQALDFLGWVLEELTAALTGRL